jgi:pimeloyl-ACP methyl ester carboxylesterase
MEPLQQHSLAFRGRQLRYVKGGQGPPLVFLHNGGGFWQSWEYQIRFFQATYTVYGLDWPCLGASDEFPLPLELELLYEALRELVRVEAMEQLSLAGNCIGASAAYLFTLRHPALVQRLVLFNICPGELIIPGKFMRKWIFQLNSFPFLKRIASHVLKFIFLKSPVRRKFPTVLFARFPDRNSQLFRKYEEVFKTDKQTRARINLLFSVDTYTFTRYLQTETRIPHFLIWGAENAVTPYSSHGVFHKNLLEPERFELVVGGGHLCMYEQPEKVNELLADYLDADV